MKNAVPAAKGISEVSKNTIHNETKGQGDNEKVNPFDANAQATDRDANQGRNDPGQRDTEPEGPSQVLYQEGGSHGSDEHKSGLSKRDQSRRTEKPHADRHNDVDAHHDHHVELKMATEERGREQKKHHQRSPEAFPFKR